MARDSDKIDFSPLDPSREPAHWESLVQATLAQARPMAAVHPLFASLASRSGRVALALAAAVALMAWLPSMLQASAEPATESARQSDAATQLATWASRGEVPADENIFATFGATHAGE